MNQETRQHLKTVDLSVYNAEIIQFEERLDRVEKAVDRVLAKGF